MGFETDVLANFTPQGNVVRFLKYPFYQSENEDSMRHLTNQLWVLLPGHTPHEIFISLYPGNDFICLDVISFQTAILLE